MVVQIRWKFSAPRHNDIAWNLNKYFNAQCKPKNQFGVRNSSKAAAMWSWNPSDQTVNVYPSVTLLENWQFSSWQESLWPSVLFCLRSVASLRMSQKTYLLNADCVCSILFFYQTPVTYICIKRTRAKGKCTYSDYFLNIKIE